MYFKKGYISSLGNKTPKLTDNSYDTTAGKHPHELQSTSRQGRASSSPKTMWLMAVPKQAENLKAMSTGSQNRRKPTAFWYSLESATDQFQISSWNQEGCCPPPIVGGQRLKGMERSGLNGLVNLTLQDQAPHWGKNAEREIRIEENRNNKDEQRTHLGKTGRREAGNLKRQAVCAKTQKQQHYEGEQSKLKLLGLGETNFTQKWTTESTEVRSSAKLLRERLNSNDAQTIKVHQKEKKIKTS